MNKRLRFAVVAFTLLALLMGAFPAAAKEKTVVTGEVYTLKQIAGDVWVTDHYIVHERNEYINQQFVASDPRLDGYSVMNNNAEYFFTEDWTFRFGHFWATWTIYAEPEFITPKWECKNTGKWDANWYLSAKGVCQGVGENEGLHVQLWFSITDWSLSYMVLYGEIH